MPHGAWPYKYSERREHRQTKNEVFRFVYAEPQPIFVHSTNIRKVSAVANENEVFRFAPGRPLAL